MKTPDHLSYDKYKKNKQTNPKRRFFLFVGTFIISLCAFLVIATLMAPDVDVTIGDEPELEEKNIGLGVKQFVDSRLKAIELDDIGKSTLTKPFEDEEKNEVSERTGKSPGLRRARSVGQEICPVGNIME